MKKTILLLLLTLMLSGCAATLQDMQGCHELSKWFVKSDQCESGYLTLYQAGPAYCASKEDIQKIKDYCGLWFN